MCSTSRAGITLEKSAVCEQGVRLRLSCCEKSRRLLRFLSWVLFQNSHPFLHIVTPNAVAFATSHLEAQAALSLSPDTQSKTAFATHGQSSVSPLT